MNIANRLNATRGSKYISGNIINNSECSLLKCFNPKRVYIEGIGQRDDITVGITNNKFKGYNCLLNYKLMEG